MYLSMSTRTPRLHILSRESPSSTFSQIIITFPFIQMFRIFFFLNFFFPLSTHPNSTSCSCLQYKFSITWPLLTHSLIAQLIKNLPTMPGDPDSIQDSWIGKIRWRRDRLPTSVILGFPCGSAGKESACNAGDLGSVPGLGGCPGEGKGYPQQYSGLENTMDCIKAKESQRVGHDWATFTSLTITTLMLATLAIRLEYCNLIYLLNDLEVHQQMNGYKNCSTYIQ